MRTSRLETPLDCGIQILHVDHVDSAGRAGIGDDVAIAVARRIPVAALMLGAWGEQQRPLTDDLVNAGGHRHDLRVVVTRGVAVDAPLDHVGTAGGDAFRRGDQAGIVGVGEWDDHFGAADSQLNPPDRKDWSVGGCAHEPTVAVRRRTWNLGAVPIRNT